MKNFISAILIFCLTLSTATPLLADDQIIPDNDVQLINNQVEAKVYSFKKTKYYTAVEIGFTNPSDHYVEFTPKEIFVDDEVKYSQPLLSMDQISEIEQRKPGSALFPTALAGALGIAALATSRYNHDAAFWLGMSALTAGGAALLTKGLEERAKQSKLIAFENNTFSDIKKLPPGMTLGGVLYFSPTKHPKSVTIVARTSSGGFEKKTFTLEKHK